MRIIAITIFILLLSLTYISGQNNKSLEKKLDEVSTWQEEVNLYLSQIDTIVWNAQDLEEGKKYFNKLMEVCQNQNCQEQILIAKAYLSELEINLGDYSTIEELILPAFKEKKALSPKTKALFHESAGYYFLVKGNSTEALTHLLVAQQSLEKKQSNSKRLGKVYYYLGFAHNIDGTNKKSTEYLKKAIDQFILLQDPPMILEAKSGLSTLLATDGKYKEAIDLLLESIKIADTNEISAMKKFQLYDALIDIYIRNGNFKKAEKSHNEIMPQLYSFKLPVEQKANNLWSFHMSYAKLMGRIDRFQEGLQHVDSAYVYADYLGDFTIRITDLRRAGLLVKSSNYEIAESHMTTLLEKMKPYGNVDAFHAVMVGLFSTIYSNSSLQPNNQLKQELLPIVDRIISKNKDEYNLDVLDAEKLSAVLGICNSDRDRSLQSFSRVLQIKDSLQNAEQIKATNELLVQYETDEKERLIQIQKLELSQKTLQRNSLIGILLGSIFGIGVLFLFYFQKKKYAIHLEEEVQKRTAELQQSNLYLSESKEELERYNYIASHDLKEPLRSVVSFVEFIKMKKFIKNEEALVYFGYIEKGAKQMNKIVQDLADFSKLRKMKVTMQNIDVHQMVTETIDDIKANIDIPLTTIDTKNLPVNIISDRNILNLVFKNIIENGLKFNENDYPFVKIEYKNLEDQHVFEISDNGIGIEGEYHGQIFELFKRLNDRSKYSGSGVGLAVCKRLINQIHGKISIKSNSNQGSTFIIEVPMNQEIKKQSILKKELVN